MKTLNQNWVTWIAEEKSDCFGVNKYWLPTSSQYAPNWAEYNGFKLILELPFISLQMEVLRDIHETWITIKTLYRTNFSNNINQCFAHYKGQIKPKVDWHAIDFPKKQMKEFGFFAKKQNKQTCSFGFWENLPRANLLTVSSVL